MNSSLKELSKIATRVKKEPHSKGSCFVIMSFSGNPILESYYELGIKPIIESNGLRSVRIDQEVFTGKITEEIKTSIESASIIVVDLTEDKPNCYFELGYAVAKEKNFIIQRLNAPSYEVKFAFDIQDYPHILYTTIEDLKLKLDKKLKSIIKNY